MINYASAKITILFNHLEGLLYRYLERRLAQHIRDFLRRTYNVELERIVIEQPPNVQFGEYALPLAFELAKKLRKAPRKIAEEIAHLRRLAGQLPTATAARAGAGPGVAGQV